MSESTGQITLDEAVTRFRTETLTDTVVDGFLGGSIDYTVLNQSDAEPEIETDPSPTYSTAVELFLNMKRVLFTASGDSKSVAENVIVHAGNLPGKQDSPVSLSSHLLNVAVAGMKLLAYDLAYYDDLDTYSDRHIKTFLAGLVLHDVDKYVRHTKDEDVDGNSRDVLEQYLDDDDFDMTEYLVDESDIDNLLYLILHTETGESTTDVSESEIDDEIVDLARYCRIADSTCSDIRRNGIDSGVNHLSRKYNLDDADHVHCIKTYETTTPIAGHAARTTMKKVIEGHLYETGAYGVVIGSTPNGILYLGDELSQSSAVELCLQYIRPEMIDMTTVEPELTHQKLEYDILSRIDTPLEKKREYINDEITNLLEAGSGMTNGPYRNGIESIPDEILPVLPELTHRIFIPRDHDPTHPSFDDEQAALVANMRENAEDRCNRVTRKVHLLSELVANYHTAPAAIDAWATEYREEFEQAVGKHLPPSESTIVDVLESTFEPQTTGADRVIDADDMCFLCGESADLEFQKNGDVYGSYGYSKRTKPMGRKKSICNTCNMEFSMLKHRIASMSNVNLSNNIEYVYIHAGDYISYLSDGSTLPRVSVSNGTIRIEDPNPSETFEGKTTIIPIRVNSYKDPRQSKSDVESDRQVRMKQLKRLFRYIEHSGSQISLGEPFESGGISDELFRDSNPPRYQKQLGLDIIEDWDGLARATSLIEILEYGRHVDNVDEYYTTLDTDDLESIVALAYNTYDLETEYRQTDIREKIREYLHNYHYDQTMMMKQVAQAGIDLHGELYESKYKKTKIFRHAVDHLVDAFSRGMEEDAAIEKAAAKAFDDAQREGYSGHVTTDQAQTFVREIVGYCKEYGYYHPSEPVRSAESLNNNLNDLANAYIYGLNHVQCEDNGDADATASGDVEPASPSTSGESTGAGGDA